MPLPLIRPMLAKASEPFDSPDHLFEIKWDGTRCIVYVDEGAERPLRMLNRRDVEMLGRYPELACLAALPSGTILDSEIVVLEEGRPSFEKLAQREHAVDGPRIEMLARSLPATMMVFDVMYVDGQRVMDEPLTSRKQRLAPLVEKLGSPHVMAPEAIAEHGIEYFKGVEKLGLEGIVAKRRESQYRPGQRGDDWLKIKVAKVEDFEVIGFVASPEHGWLSALALGERRGRRWDYKGNVGSGFTDDQRRQILHSLEQAEPLDATPKGELPKDVQWRATGLRCKVRYFEKTYHGMLRGPVFLGWV